MDLKTGLPRNGGCKKHGRRSTQNTAFFSKAAVEIPID
jgi:hypothetical protein